MKTVQLVLDENLYNALGLSNSSDAGAVGVAIKNMAAENTTLKANETKHTAKITELENKITTLTQPNNADEVEKLLEEAQTPGKVKITNKTRTAFAAQFKDNPEGLKAVLNTLEVIPSVVDNLKQDDKNAPRYKALSAMSLDDMLEKELASECKNTFPDLFKEKYIEAKGQEAWDNTYGK